MSKKNFVALAQQTRHVLEDIIQHISQAILLIDFNGTIKICNIAAANLLQKKREAILFQNFWTHFDDRIFGFSVKNSQVQKQALWAVPATLKVGSIHKTKTIETDVTFINEGMILTIRDISHLLRMEALKRKHTRAKELQEMAAMLAHEIRNPLGGIKGFAHLLQRDLEDKPTLKRLAGYIEKGVANLETTLTKVLNHYHHLHLAKVDLVQLIEELIEHLKVDASLNVNIQWESAFSPSSIIAVLDAVAIKSALLNLCSNAIKAMPEGGVLRLEAEETSKEIMIKVIDTGEGISTENLQNLFTPFFTTRPYGHGFGLSEVQEIVQAHEGKIEVYSEVNKGTTFNMRIPKK